MHIMGIFIGLWRACSPTVGRYLVFVAKFLQLAEQQVVPEDLANVCVPFVLARKQKYVSKGKFRLSTSAELRESV